MPVVPRLASRQVATAPLPGARLSPDAPAAAFGVPATVDLSGPTKLAAGILEEERAKADQVALLDADNQLATLQSDLETQAQQRRGRDALGATEEIQRQWQARASQIGQGLTSDRQRLAFQQRLAARGQSLYATVERHAAGEAEQYDQDQTTAAVGNRVDAAVKDPTTAPQAAAEAGAIIADYGTRHGWAPEQITAKRAAATSRVHAAALSELLAGGQDLAAQAYYDAHQDALVGDDAVRAQSALQEGAARGAAQREADRITGAAPTLTAALEQARGLTDPRVRELTETRIRQFFSDRAAAARDASEARMLRATNLVEQQGAIAAVPPTLWNDLTLGERSALRAYADRLHQGTPIQTDQPTWYRLMRQATGIDPDAKPGETPHPREEVQREFADLNLLTLRGKLSDADFQQLATLQASIRRGDGKADEALNSFGTQDQVITSTLKAAGIDPTPKPGTDAARQVDAFRQAVSGEAIRLQRETGKKVTTEQLQQLVDDLVIRQKKAGTGLFGFFQREQFGFEMTIADVPAADRAQITEALTQRGLAVTDQAILDLYRRQRARTGARE